MLNADYDSLTDGAENRRKLEQERLEGVVLGLSQTKDGRHFLRWLLRETRATSQEYVPDEKLAQWLSGRRSVGMQVFALCAAVNVLDKVMTKELV